MLDLIIIGVIVVACLAALAAICIRAFRREYRENRELAEQLSKGTLEPLEPSADHDPNAMHLPGLLGQLPKPVIVIGAIALSALSLVIGHYLGLL